MVFGLTSLSMRTDTDKGSNTVDACRAWAAGSCSAVVNVLRTVGTAPAIDAHAHIATDQVAASSPILASVRL